MQNIVDDCIYSTVDGGAWVKIIDSTGIVGGGGGGTLQSAYNGGNTIAVTATNPVAIANAAGVSSVALAISNLTTATNSNGTLTVARTAVPDAASTWSGSLISASNTPTGTNSSTSSGSIVSISHVPVAGAGTLTDNTVGLAVTVTAAAGNLGTAKGIVVDMSGSGTSGSPSASAVPGLVITGAFSSVAKGTGGTNALVQILSSYRNATALSVRLRNKQALAGSAVFIGWDATNYEGAVANTTLTGQTHVVTIDAATNVTAGAQEVVGLRVLVPASSSASTRGIVISTLQTAGQAFETSVTGATTLSGSYIAHSIDLSNITGGLTQRVSGLVMTLPASTSSSSTGITISTIQTAGTMMTSSFFGATTLSASFTGISVDLATNVASTAQEVYGADIYMPETSNSNSAGVRVISLQTNGYGLYVDMQGTSAPGALNAAYLQVGATAQGACVVISHSGSTASGGSIALRIQGSDQSCGIDIAQGDALAVSNAGEARLRYNSGTSTLQVSLNAAAFVDFVTGTAVTLQNAYLGGRTITVTTATGSVQLTSTRTSGTIFDINSTAVLVGTLNGATIDLSGVTAGAQAVFGLNVLTPVSSNNGTMGIQVQLAQTAGYGLAVYWPASKTFTDTTTGIDVNMSNGNDASTFRQRGVFVSMAIGTNAASSGVEVFSRQNAAYLFRGRYADVGTTTATGTTIGFELDLASNGAGGNQQYKGVNVILPTGTASTSFAATFDYRGLAGTAAGNAIVNIVTNVSGTTTGGLQFLEIGADTATLTLGAAVIGIDIDLQTNVTHGSQRMRGVVVSLPATNQATSFCYEATSVQTAGVGYYASFTGVGTVYGANINMLPTGAAAAVGVQVTMGANASGAAISIAHNGSGNNADQLSFTSIVDGTGAHLRGPTTGSFVIKAGISTGVGRDITCTASAGVTSGAGGGFFVTSGAAAGAASNGGDISFTTGALAGTGRRGYTYTVGAFAETKSTVTFNAGGTSTVNCGDGNCFTSTATGATTWAFSKPMDTGFVYSFLLVLTNGGAGAQTWTSAGTGGTAVKWPGGTAPTLQAAGTDVLVFFTVDGGTTWRGVLSQSDSK